MGVRGVRDERTVIGKETHQTKGMCLDRWVRRKGAKMHCKSRSGKKRAAVTWEWLVYAQLSTQGYVVGGRGGVGGGVGTQREAATS